MVGELGGDEDCKNFQSQRGDGEEKVTNIKKNYIYRKTFENVRVS